MTDDKWTKLDRILGLILFGIVVITVVGFVIGGINHVVTKENTSLYRDPFKKYELQECRSDIMKIHLDISLTNAHKRCLEIAFIYREKS